MMNLNATLLCEFVIFGTFFKVVQQKIWPIFMKVLDDRRREIEEGLEAAAQHQASVEKVEQEAEAILMAAQEKAQSLLDQAQHHVAVLHNKAQEEAHQLMQHAQRQSEKEYEEMKKVFLQDAKEHYATVSLEMCKKVLGQQLDQQSTLAVVQSALEQLEH